MYSSTRMTTAFAMPARQGIGGVTVQLLDANGNPTGRTGDDKRRRAANLGYYIFSDLRPGTYGVAETQPAAFDDGKDQVGSAGGTALAQPGDRITGAIIASEQNALNYNFGELIPPGSLCGLRLFRPRPRLLPRRQRNRHCGSSRSLARSDRRVDSFDAHRLQRPLLFRQAAARRVQRRSRISPTVSIMAGRPSAPAPARSSAPTTSAASKSRRASTSWTTTSARFHPRASAAMCSSTPTTTASATAASKASPA